MQAASVDYRLCASLILSARSAPPAADLSPEIGDRASLSADLAFWRARCRAVAAMIASLDPSREKLLLSLHYLRGIPIEKIADRLGTSRRTAYRVHLSALSMIARRLDRDIYYQFNNYFNSCFFPVHSL